MENVEKCTVAMLGGPCSQHVTGNTSQLNQPQSAIIINKPLQSQLMLCMPECYLNKSLKSWFLLEQGNEISVLTVAVILKI